ncbi:DNA-3-methyladenine glycosylase I [Devosia sp. YIM 151766]|uniref:DNA-3-methyladenine glycosylase I n=1 Tax=Devosia sp. YIM 151766 TaxID=3017325 RepID=UPI00255C63CF|nr:DNA-3-methyladenine glycosylase I [Devosia sp. YIM 151766]WIY52996.1 DNA-3-methyladenine glycosylase I [Devosia sp. YIM 151766]
MTTIEGPDGLHRCRWCAGAAELLPYHDREWGFPVGDDRRLFEKLSLEAFQSGLSWRTILNKRAAFRAGFADFDIDRVAAFTGADIARLLADPGIVRHRAKIEAVINNAARAQELIAEAGSLAAFVWRYEARIAAPPQSRSTSPESEALSRALKQRGWRFLGPTTVFAFMQAMGLINDHAEGCISRDKAAAMRDSFMVPGR